jgi:oxygen-independent coproporphyrinogen-3 oxidase
MLEVDDDSRLGRELIAGGARYHARFVPHEDVTADFYQQACDMLNAAGIEQYEISNFARAEAKASNQSRHNLKYWTRQPYLGFGVDAHSMLDGRARVVTRQGPVQAVRGSADVDSYSEPIFATTVDSLQAGLPQAVRLATPDSLDAYMNRSPHTVTPVSAQTAIEESFFLGLRLNRGIDLAETRFWEGHDFSRAIKAGEKSALAAEANRGQQQKFSPDLIAAWESAIKQSLEEGLLEQQGTILRLTARGRLLSNEVFARFLIEPDEEIKVGTGNVNPR